jgi:xanthine dehydrogenase accessory factor
METELLQGISVVTVIGKENLTDSVLGRKKIFKIYSPKKSTGANDFEMLSSADREVMQKTFTGDETPAAVAIITKTGGSTPRKAGARMLVYGDGRMLGSIGGGCGESYVRMAALGVIDEMASCMKKVSLNADTAGAEGMVCGGTMEVFIEPVEAYKKVFSGGEKNASK